MDVMELFHQVCRLFIRYWSIRLTVGSHSVTVGAVVIFCAIVGLVMSFIRGLAD